MELIDKSEELVVVVVVAVLNLRKENNAKNNNNHNNNKKIGNLVKCQPTNHNAHFILRVNRPMMRFQKRNIFLILIPTFS